LLILCLLLVSAVGGFWFYAQIQAGRRTRVLRDSPGHWFQLENVDFVPVAKNETETVSDDEMLRRAAAVGADSFGLKDCRRLRNLLKGCHGEIACLGTYLRDDTADVPLYLIPEVVCTEGHPAILFHVSGRGSGWRSVGELFFPVIKTGDQKASGSHASVP
jgi:hypothetical protein